MFLFSNLHLGDVREVSGADVVLSLQDGVDLGQTHDQLLLLLLSTEKRRHLLLQVTDDVGVDLQGATERQTENSRNPGLKKD